MESRREKAIQLFQEGYNCSQAVFAAFCDDYDISKEMALKLSSSFGGGMGRMREVCGAVSGMFLVAGLETGATDGRDADGKKRNYDMVQKLAAKYREKNGSIICRELLGLGQDNTQKAFTDTNPEARTEQYYKKRPCASLVGDAVDILEEELLQSTKESKKIQAKIEMVRVEDDESINKLAGIADEVWHQHFATILSLEQIDYMVDKFQSVKAMTEQMKSSGYEYYFIVVDGITVGYTGIRPEEGELFLSKLYILEKYRGNQYASYAFEFLKEYCKERGLHAIWLTVNRYNYDTIRIYEKKGFETIRTQISDIGNGFVMDDYVMELKF